MSDVISTEKKLDLLFAEWIYLTTFLATIVFLAFRHVIYTIDRYKKKREVSKRSHKSIQLDI